MIRTVLMIFFFTVLASCSTPDPSPEIVRIMRLETDLDLTNFQCTTVSDTTLSSGLMATNHWNSHSFVLQFDSVAFEKLKDTIRSSAYFNALDFPYAPMDRETWANHAPAAHLGLWMISGKCFEYVPRLDRKGVPRPESVYSNIYIDTVNRVLKFKRSDFSGYPWDPHIR